MVGVIGRCASSLSRAVGARWPLLASYSNKSLWSQRIPCAQAAASNALGSWGQSTGVKGVNGLASGPSCAARGMATSRAPQKEDNDENDPDEVEDGDYGIDIYNKSSAVEEVERMPIVKVIDINRVAVVKKGGKVLSFAAIVVVGNGKGLAAIGKGKDAEVSRAVEKAVVRAHTVRNMHYFELYDGRTIFHDIEHTFKKTKIVALASKEGVGLRANNVISDMCECIGISDLRCKVHGSTNAHNLVRAFWDTLLQVRTPETLSRFTGKAMLDMASLRAGLGPGQSTILPRAKPTAH